MKEQTSNTNSNKEETSLKSLMSAGGLKLEKMGELINASFPKIETAKEKNIVLIIGNAGAGKSSLINYLLGHTLEKEKLEWGEVRAIVKNAVPGVKVAEIGHNDAETVSPEVYKGKKEDIAWCDCPGFLDNRAEEVKICTSIHTQLAVKFASSVRAVIIVIDIRSILVDRGESLRNLGVTLAKLIKNVDVASSSLFFAITKAENCDEKAESAIKEKITQIISTMEKNASTNQNSNELSQNQLKILKLMQNNLNNVQLVDVFDKGHSKQRIMNQLDKLQPISKQVFEFGRYDDSWVKFNEIIVEMVQSGAKMMREKLFLTETILHHERELKNAHEMEQTYKKLIKMIHDLKKSGEFADSLQEITKMRKALEDNKASINRFRSDIQGLNEEITPLNRQITEKDTHEAIQYWQESCDEKEASWWSYAEKKFNYKGVPFLRVDEIKGSEKGNFINPIVKKVEGEYQATYQSVRFNSKPGVAQVTIYIENRVHPVVKQEIENLKARVAEKKETIERYKRDIRDLEANSQIIQIAINICDTYQRDNQAIKNTTDQIIDLESRIRKLTEDMHELEKNKNGLEEELKLAEKMINTNKSVLEIIHRLLPHINVSQNLTLDFNEHYEKLFDTTKKSFLSSEHHIAHSNTMEASSDKNESHEKTAKNTETDRYHTDDNALIEENTKLKQKIESLEEEIQQLKLKLRMLQENNPIPPLPQEPLSLSSDEMGQSSEHRIYPMPILPPLTGTDLPMPSKELLAQFEKQSLAQKKQMLTQLQREIHEAEKAFENKEVSQMELKEVAETRNRREPQPSAASIDTRSSIKQEDIAGTHKRIAPYNEHLEAIRKGAKLKPIPKETSPQGNIKKVIDNGNAMKKELEDNLASFEAALKAKFKNTTDDNDNKDNSSDEEWENSGQHTSANLISHHSSVFTHPKNINQPNLSSTHNPKPSNGKDEENKIMKTTTMERK